METISRLKQFRIMATKTREKTVNLSSLCQHSLQFAFLPYCQACPTKHPVQYLCSCTLVVTGACQTKGLQRKMHVVIPPTPPLTRSIVLLNPFLPHADGSKYQSIKNIKK